MTVPSEIRPPGWWSDGLARLIAFFDRVFAQPARPRGEAQALRQRRRRKQLAELSKRLQTLTDEELEEATLPGDARELPCELFITTGSRSFALFKPGPIDDLAFFQRYEVSSRHEMEFVTRLDLEDQGSENYRPFALIRFSPRDEIELPALNGIELKTALYRDLGLLNLPKARRFLGESFRGYRMGRGTLEDGMNRVRGGDRLYKKASGRRHSYGQVVDALRTILNELERVAWLEEAFTRPPERGEVIHRYYLTSRRRLLLVRHHWDEGKRVYRARTSTQALQIVEASGAFSRMEQRRVG